MTQNHTNLKSENKAKVLALIAVALTSFLIPFSMSSINIALPLIGQHFKMNAVMLGWVSSSTLITASIFLIPFGRISDLYGRKRTFVIGSIIFTLASFLSAVSNSATLLLFSRVLLGIGSAFIFGTGPAILTSIFASHERGRALGIYSTSVYIGGTLGPFIGGILSQHLGWRSIFILSTAIGLAAFCFIKWGITKEWSEARGEKLDIRGSLIFSISMASIMYGFTSLPATPAILFIIFGMVGIIVFFKWESLLKNPILTFNHFRNNKSFSISILATLMNHTSTFAVSFLLSLYLQFVKGFSPQSAGLLLVILPLFQAMVSPFAGRLSDKIEPRIVTAFGMAITSISLFLLAFLDSDTGIILCVIGLSFLGIGLGLFAAPNANAIMSSVEKKTYGVAASVQATVRMIGSQLSMGIIIIIFSVIIGKVQITADNATDLSTSLRLAFIVYGIICFAGIFPSMIRGNIHKKSNTLSSQ